ncbi:MAG: VOC family protein [Acidimicrobiia bacterium]
MCDAGSVLTLGAPVQIAYSVDAGVPLRRHAVEHASRWGSGPFVTAEHIALSSCRIDGVNADFDHSSAYGWWGEVMVELVMEHTRPVVPPGRLHHLAFMVESLPAAIDLCRAGDAPVVLEATTASGTDFVFCDARDSSGHLIELYERSDALVGFYDRVRAMARI